MRIFKAKLLFTKLSPAYLEGIWPQIGEDKLLAKIKQFPPWKNEPNLTWDTLKEFQDKQGNYYIPVIANGLVIDATLLRYRVDCPDPSCTTHGREA